MKGHPPPDFLSVSVVQGVFVFVSCRGWGQIPCRTAWLRAARSGNPRPSRVSSSMSSCPVTKSSKACRVYLLASRCPSVRDCPGFYCLVLFTIPRAHNGLRPSGCEPSMCPCPSPPGFGRGLLSSCCRWPTPYSTGMMGQES